MSTVCVSAGAPFWSSFGQGGDKPTFIICHHEEGFSPTRDLLSSRKLENFRLRKPCVRARLHRLLKKSRFRDFGVEPAFRLASKSFFSTARARLHRLRFVSAGAPFWSSFGQGGDKPTFIICHHEEGFSPTRDLLSSRKLENFRLRKPCVRARLHRPLKKSRFRDLG